MIRVVVRRLGRVYMFSLRTGGERLLRRWVTAFADTTIVGFLSSGGESAGSSERLLTMLARPRRSRLRPGLRRQ